MLLTVIRCIPQRLRQQFPSTTASCSECEVTTRWMGFHRIWHGSGEVFDTVDLFLPDVQFTTQARTVITQLQG